MKKIVYTVQELARPEHLGRSPNWIRCAIHQGLILAERAGNSFVVPAGERDRVKGNLPTISRRAYSNVGQTK